MATSDLRVDLSRGENTGEEDNDMLEVWQESHMKKDCKSKGKQVTSTLASVARADEGDVDNLLDDENAL